MTRRHPFPLGLSVLAAAGVFCPALFSADSGPAKLAASGPELKTADEVLKKWVEAIGGEATARKLTTRVSKGSLTMEAQGVSVDVKVEAKAPSMRLLTINLPGGVGDVVSGFDGTTGWRSMPGLGVQDLEGAELDSAKSEANYWETLELKRHFQKLELKASEKVEGSDCYVLEATNAKAKPQKLYFSKQSGLLVRRDAEAPTLAGVADTVTYFEDYRAIDGMKLPFKLRRPLPADSAFTFIMTEVSHKTPVDDARFKRPETK